VSDADVLCINSTHFNNRLIHALKDFTIWAALYCISLQLRICVIDAMR